MPPSSAPLASGDVLGDRYRITGSLGAGGMALVYRADDFKHGRTVAVKVLRAQDGVELASERFSQEIRTTATLQHPHIVPVFDSGSFGEHHFYVMPLVEGESLQARLDRSGPLATDEALRIVREIASALDHAHAKGILHRDLKPANILLSQGHAMLADFGIARLVDVGGDDRLTRTGTSLGTPAYMSPEQATGDDSVGPPSDVYSLAAICFELLAGVPPFTGATPEAVLIKRFTEDAPSLSAVRSGIPTTVVAAVARGLRRDPVERFASAGAFAAALGPVTAVSASPTAQGIAVLPFINASASADDQYFADGLSEEITLMLTKLPSLRVIARTTMQGFRGRTDAVVAAGRELGVTHVLEGSVRRAGERLRVTAALIRTTDQTSVWSERFDGTLDDVFDVQDRIASAVLEALAVALAPEEERAVHARPDLAPAEYDMLLRARYDVARATPTSIMSATEVLEQALQRAPENTRLLHGLAFAYWQTVNLNLSPDRALTLRKAVACVERMEAIVPGSPQAAEIRGMIAIFEGDLLRSWQELATAYEVLGNEGEVGTWFSVACFFTGHTEIGLAVAREAVARDPRHPMMWCAPPLLLLYAGRYDEALRAAESAPPSASRALAGLTLGLIHLGRGDRAAVLAATSAHRADDPSQDAWSAMVELIYFGALGDRASVDALLDPTLEANVRGDLQNAELVAEVFLLLGDVDTAASYLASSAEQGLAIPDYITTHNALWRAHAGDPRLAPVLALIRANAERASRLVIPPRLRALAAAAARVSDPP